MSALTADLTIAPCFPWTSNVSDLVGWAGGGGGEGGHVV